VPAICTRAGAISFYAMWIKQPTCSRERAPQILGTGLFTLLLAGALGLKGGVDPARSRSSRDNQAQTGVCSLAQYDAYSPWQTDPEYLALRAKTLDVGLRRAGFPDK
jgi:hypothetical protein